MCYIALGSNLAGPTGQVRSGITALAGLPASRLLRSSSLYRSAPMGPPEQPDYINAVVALETGLSPQALLASLHAIEDRHGRVRGPERWGPRTLDLDLLLYGEERITGTELVVPHPGLALRPFVLYPLQEIEPELQIPGLGPLWVLIERCPAAGLSRICEGPSQSESGASLTLRPNPESSARL